MYIENINGPQDVKKLTVEDLLHKFEEASGGEVLDDKAILG